MGAIPHTFKEPYNFIKTHSALYYIRKPYNIKIIGTEMTNMF
jgi:hypothetical protein